MVAVTFLTRNPESAYKRFKALQCKRRHVNAHNLKPLVSELISGDVLHDALVSVEWLVGIMATMATSLIGARISSWTVARSVVSFLKFISFS